MKITNVRCPRWKGLYGLILVPIVYITWVSLPGKGAPAEEEMRRISTLQSQNKHGNTPIVGNPNHNELMVKIQKVDPPTGMVLLWMPFFGDDNWNLGDKLGSFPFEDRKCPQTNCLVSNNRKDLAKADMLLFHCVDKLDKWPKKRTANQVYAGYCWEAPTHHDFSKLDPHLNMTITYRLDSDFVDWPGHFAKRAQSLPGKYASRIPFTEKTSNIVWTVSHCPTVSKREKYVDKLEKFIDVDIYGSCGKLKCPKSDYDGCYAGFEKKYKFFLAFENNICVDYVTEKFFRPLEYELVPIVMGGGQYEKLAPPHSYINVEDYKSPADLAKYLNYLAGNETAYNEYFQWKQHYVSDKPNLWCEVCRHLNMVKAGKFHKEARPINPWYMTDACNNDLVPRKLS